VGAALNARFSRACSEQRPTAHFGHVVQGFAASPTFANTRERYRIRDVLKHWIEMLIFELFWKYDRVGRKFMDRVKDSEEHGDRYVPRHDGK
jgi:hypothetical protein